MDRPEVNIRDGGVRAGVTGPVIFADVPDPDVIFDGRYYYMVSTTMYFAPSVPIMRSGDLVHWSIAGYTAAILDDTDALALRNGQDAYGQGSWAASIRFHDGTYYVSVGSLTTRQTYVYSTPDIEHGPWTRSVLDGYAHDQSLLFDGDDVWLVYGGGSIDLRRLRRHDDGTLAWDGPATRLVEDADVDQTSGLNAEGAHAYRIGDYYYVFMIEWPSGGIRQEVLWRSTSLTPQSAGGVGGPGRAQPWRDGRGPTRNRRRPGRSRPDIRRTVVRHAVPGRGPAGSCASAHWRDLGRRRVAGVRSPSASARGGRTDGR
ncbi:family 43 glycosylhydrolase [Catellatospora coxensis]